MENRRSINASNYPAALLAKKDLLNMAGFSAVENVPHMNPVTKQACNGSLVISFTSWEAALRSVAMEKNGGVSGRCTTCGGGGFIGANKMLLKQ